MWDHMLVRKYKRTPSLLWDFGVLIFWLLVLTVGTYAAATKLFEAPFDIDFFSARMAPVYSLFGTVCLAYEFFTAMRNESNRGYLIRVRAQAMDARDAAASIIVDSDREKRIADLNRQIEGFNKDLVHESRYVRRKFVFAWFGIFLVVIATFLQLPR